MKSMVILAGAVLCAGSSAAQFNYDEAKVPKYTLPPALKMADGKPVKTVKAWEMQRRVQTVIRGRVE